MDITTLIKDTKIYTPSDRDKYDNPEQDNLNRSSLLVVELTNGFSIIYEKGKEQLARISLGGKPHYIEGSETESVKYHILRPGRGRISSGENARSLETGLSDSFSPWGEERINSYAIEKRTHSVNVDTYEKILEPLQTVEKKRRSWGYISLILGGTVAWPVTAPVVLLSSLIFGRCPEPLAALLYAPLHIPGIARELVKPSVTYNKVLNKEILSSEPGEKRAAIFFGGYQGSGSKTPDDFQGSPYLLFSDGMWANQCRAFFEKHTKEEDKEKYRESECFVEVNPVLETMMRKSVAAEEEMWKEWQNFKPTQEEHKALLRNIGFIR